MTKSYLITRATSAADLLTTLLQIYAPHATALEFKSRADAGEEGPQVFLKDMISSLQPGHPSPSLSPDIASRKATLVVTGCVGRRPGSANLPPGKVAKAGRVQAKLGVASKIDMSPKLDNSATNKMHIVCGKILQRHSDAPHAYLPLAKQPTWTVPTALAIMTGLHSCAGYEPAFLQKKMTK